jgi:lipoprotein-releasing system permease protein
VEHDVASLVVASGVAERMGVYVGDTVELLSPQAIERAVNTMTLPRGVRAVVRGIFQSNAAREIDHSRVYVSQSALGRAIGTVAATSADAVYVSAAQAVEQAESSAERLRTMLGPGYTVRTWADVNRGLVETMKLERVGSFIVLALIIVVAAFNVLVALSLGVVEKRRDIAVLLTLGLRPRDIRMMYIRQGLALGIVAVGIGLLLGVGLTWGQITYSWISFDVSQGYLVPALPMKIEVLDVLLTAAVGLVLAATAAAYPAGRAARTQIADALRSE